jgi:hypothetical protein
MVDLKERLQELADAAVREGHAPGAAAAIRRGRRCRRRRITAGLLLAALFTGGLSVGVGRLAVRPAAPTPLTQPVIPAGWTDVRFHGLVFSVPATWTRLAPDDVPCGVHPPDGPTVVVGDQTRFPHCTAPNGLPQAPVVRISSYHGGGYAYARPASVNGLRLRLWRGPVQVKQVPPGSPANTPPALVTWATGLIAVFDDQHVLLDISDPSQSTVATQILQTVRIG